MLFVCTYFLWMRRYTNQYNSYFVVLFKIYFAAKRGGSSTTARLYVHCTFFTTLWDDRLFFAGWLPLWRALNAERYDWLVAVQRQMLNDRQWYSRNETDILHRRHKRHVPGNRRAHQPYGQDYGLGYGRVLRLWLRCILHRYDFASLLRFSVTRAAL